MSTPQPAGETGSTHDETCIFCCIAAGTIPSHVVYEDDRLKAFLDIRPIRPGHVLIVPKKHYDYFDDMPPELASEVVHLGQRLGKAMKAAYGVERVAFLFTGTDVTHVHAHVLPMHDKMDITSPVYIAQQELSFQLAPVAGDDELRQVLAELGARLEQEEAAG